MFPLHSQSNSLLKKMANCLGLVAFLLFCFIPCFALNEDILALQHFISDIMEYTSAGSLQIIIDNQMERFSGDDLVTMLNSDILRNYSGTHWTIQYAEEDLGNFDMIWQSVPGVNIVNIIVYSTQLGQEIMSTVAKNGTMSKGVWLLPESLATDYEEIKSRFDSGIYLYNFDDDMWTNLTEIFSLKSKHFFHNEMGYWNVSEGLVLLDKPNIWDRRTRFMEGVELVGCQKAWHPFNYVETSPNGSLIIYGLLPDTINMFQVSIMQI